MSPTATLDYVLNYKKYGVKSFKLNRININLIKVVTG